MIWLKFAFCFVVIIFAGTKLTQYGDVVAERTGWGRVWVGFAMLAVITSLPELIIGISSTALIGAPDLGMGTILGSCSFNLVIVAVLDVCQKHLPVLSQALRQHVILAGWGILLVAIVAGGIFTGEMTSLSLGWLGIPSIIILIVYLLGLRQTFRSERNQQNSCQVTPPPKYKNAAAGNIYPRFAAAALAVVAAGIWLSFVGNEIAEMTGWGTTFVGSSFLAITSSLPELVVAIAAMRLGAMDMAIANIMGSNMFNLAIIPLADIFYTSGSIFAVITTNHFITIAIIIAMNLTIIAGIKLRHKRKIFSVISWYSIILIGLYIFGAYTLFAYGTGL